MIALQAEGIPLVEESIGAATFKRLKVLELGSGCGIVGISLAQAIPDCDVLLTDLPEAREIAERNIASMNPAMGSKATFLELNWDQPLPQAVQAKPFDLILVADCTYNPDSAPSLVQTLTALVEKAPKSVVLLAMKVRHQSELVFFDLMRDAEFVQQPPLKLVLPAPGSEPEDVLVYVFYHKDRPTYADNAHPEVRKPTVQFWAE
jgi:predicted nicotinamide N-methyase